MSHLETTHRNAAFVGLSALKSQLNAVSAFIAGGIRDISRDQPYTYQTYRVLTKYVLAALDALEKASKALDVDFTVKAPEHVVVDSVERARGLIEYSLIRVGQLITPMKLQLLPPGTPGTKEFEALYKQRSNFYREISQFLQIVGDMHNAIRSEVHDLTISESERSIRYRNAKKKFLTDEIAARKKDIADAEEFLSQCRAVEKKLADELANVDQTELSGLFPEDDTPAPGAGTDPTQTETTDLDRA